MKPSLRTPEEDEPGKPMAMTGSPMRAPADEPIGMKQGGLMPVSMRARS